VLCHARKSISQEVWTLLVAFSLSMPAFSQESSTSETAPKAEKQHKTKVKKAHVKKVKKEKASKKKKEEKKAESEAQQ
jgi:hypothetical protein